MMLCWCNSLFGSTLVLLCFWIMEGGKNGIAFVGMVEVSAVFILRVWILVLEGSARLAVIMGDMMVGIAPVPTAWGRARMGALARRRSWAVAIPFSRQSVHAQQRGPVIMQDLIVLLLEVIAFAINFLLVGLFLVVLLFATRMIGALIVLMATVMLLSVAIVLVASMVVMFFGMMLPVAWVTAASNKKMSRLLLFWLLLLLELVKDAGCFIGSLTLLEKGYEPKRVHGHHFVCFCKLVMMFLGLCKKELFALLLRCGQLHCLTGITTVDVAKELHLTPHKFMHRHERGFLGSAKLTN